MMQKAKILITGPTGQVAYPVAFELAKNHEIWAAARFSDTEKRDALRSAGIRCINVDMAQGDFRELPQDFDYVLNFAVVRDVGDDFDTELIANAEAVGLLMQHCRAAKAFLHVSSCAVYHPAAHDVLTEKSPLGDNHRTMFLTYSLGKNAQEAVVRFCARAFQLPSIICRLNVPYGNNGGWPYYHLLMMEHGVPIAVNTDAPSTYTLIHEDDIIRSIPALLDAARVPAEIINWSGQDHVSIEDWCAYLGELTGLEPKFQYTPDTLPSVMSSNDKLQRIAGPTQVDWQDGLRRMVEAMRPDLLKRTGP